MAKTGKRTSLKTKLSGGPPGPTKVFLIYEIVPAFSISCFGCGKQYAAPIPPEGSLVEFRCNAEGCGIEHKMTWTGKSWKVSTPENEFVPPVEENPSDSMHKLVSEGVEALQRKQHEPEGGAFIPD